MNEPLNSPAKQYIQCMTRANNRLRAKNIIVEREKRELKSVVRARRERLSGKRKIVKGKHLVTVPELLEGIIAAEKATAEKRPMEWNRLSESQANSISQLSDKSIEERDSVCGLEHDS